MDSPSIALLLLAAALLKSFALLLVSYFIVASQDRPEKESPNKPEETSPPVSMSRVRRQRLIDKNRDFHIQTIAEFRKARLAIRAASIIAFGAVVHSGIAKIKFDKPGEISILSLGGVFFLIGAFSITSAGLLDFWYQKRIAEYSDCFALGVQTDERFAYFYLLLLFGLALTFGIFATLVIEA